MKQLSYILFQHSYAGELPDKVRSFARYATKILRFYTNINSYLPLFAGL